MQINNKLINKYSSNETKIGTWYGRPLYRKVFTINSISTSNTNLVDIQSLGIRDVVKLYGTIYTDNNQYFPMPLTDSSSNYSVIFVTATSIRGRAAIGSGNFSYCWIAIEYTKQTD